MTFTKQLKAYLESKIVGLVSYPRLMTVQIDITNACNLACSHCYHDHHSNKGAISLRDWEVILASVDSFLDKYKFFPRFMLCGGEPMLSPLLMPIVTRLRRRWPEAEIMVLSNGTIVRESIINFLKEGPVSFQISLDGPDAERHDSVRGKGSFEKSIRGIKQLIGAGIPVAILSILSQRTAPWIPDYFLLARSLKVDSQNFTRLIAQGHGQKLVESGDDLPLAGLQLRDAYADILIESYRSGVASNTDQPLFVLLDENLGQSNLFGYDSIIIDYKGNLKATSRSGYVIGNLLTQRLEDLYLENEAFLEVRNRKVDICGNCKFFDRCGGDRNAAFVEYGDFTARDPGCWKHLL